MYRRVIQSAVFARPTTVVPVRNLTKLKDVKLEKDGSIVDRKFEGEGMFQPRADFENSPSSADSKTSAEILQHEKSPVPPGSDSSRMTTGVNNPARAPDNQG